MIAIVVEPIEIALLRSHLRARIGRHLLVEDPVTEPLRGLDLGRGPREPHLEAAGDNTRHEVIIAGHVRQRSRLSFVPSNGTP